MAERIPLLSPDCQCEGDVRVESVINSLLHGEESDVFGDAGYQGAHKRPDARKDFTWHVAMSPGKRKELS